MISSSAVFRYNVYYHQLSIWAFLKDPSFLFEVFECNFQKYISSSSPWRGQRKRFCLWRSSRYVEKVHTLFWSLRWPRKRMSMIVTLTLLKENVSRRFNLISKSHVHALKREYWSCAQHRYNLSIECFRVDLRRLYF